MKPDPNRKWFLLLDKLFWVLWIAFPIMFLTLAYFIADPATYTTGLTDAQIACFGSTPIPTNYSFSGKLLFWSIFVVQFVFYGTLFYILHLTIHRFAKGDIFDFHTLRRMHILGVILIGFPIFTFVQSAIVSYGLLYTDKIDSGSLEILDVGPIAVGIFIIAIKLVLQNAMSLKTENDLTI